MRFSGKYIPNGKNTRAATIRKKYSESNVSGSDGKKKNAKGTADIMPMTACVYVCNFNLSFHFHERILGKQRRNMQTGTPKNKRRRKKRRNVSFEFKFFEPILLKLDFY